MHGDDLTDFAASMLEAQRARQPYFPKPLLTGDQVWNIVLVLFIADADGERLTGRAVVQRIGGSMDVGARWIKYLTHAGFIVGDGVGNLDDVLAMTPFGISQLEGWLAASRAILGVGSTGSGSQGKTTPGRDGRYKPRV